MLLSLGQPEQGRRREFDLEVQLTFPHALNTRSPKDWLTSISHIYTSVIHQHSSSKKKKNQYLYVKSVHCTKPFSLFSSLYIWPDSFISLCPLSRWHANSQIYFLVCVEWWTSHLPDLFPVSLHCTSHPSSVTRIVCMYSLPDPFVSLSLLSHIITKSISWCCSHDHACSVPSQ